MKFPIRADVAGNEWGSPGWRMGLGIFVLWFFGSFQMAMCQAAPQAPTASSTPPAAASKQEEVSAASKPGAPDPPTKPTVALKEAGKDDGKDSSKEEAIRAQKDADRAAAELAKAPNDPVLRAKAQLAADTARLYQLANELKVEMDKSSKDTLSLGVMRKADEIEKLAKKVREEMVKSIGN